MFLFFGMPLEDKVQSHGGTLNVHAGCACGLPLWKSGETVSSEGLQTPPIWSVLTTLSCDPQLLMLIFWPHSSLLLHWVRASQVYLSPSSWSPSYCPSMGVRDKGVVYHCGYITEIHKESPVLLSTWKRQHGSVPCRSCVDRNVTCTGESSFISFLKDSLLPGLDQGLGESGQQQAKSWADPCLFCSGFMGLHRRMRRPLCLQATVIFSTQHRWYPLQYYQLIFDYYNLP